MVQPGQRHDQGDASHRARLPVHRTPARGRTRLTDRLAEPLVVVDTDVIFMDRGAIVERAPPARIFGAPTESRTRAFLERLPEREGGVRRAR
ncbi:MAG: hypothetical protein A3J29_16885 [Acidobacteria bacterium RIFCSPLOWO2_12_FULL_67_14b]|nr:MAG: hypothetical protein A3J29_16885 [Acidobacteria bacterium RIFCSPLOWO2_12_FULL_67_14b]